MTQSFYRETGNSPSLQDVMSCEGASKCPSTAGGWVANSKSEIRNPKFRQGEELPRGSLDPGDSL